MKTLEQLGISPAPWNEKVWATSDDYGHDISDYNHKSICDMRLLQGETRIPNARLIAAAPKLYEACYEMLRYYYEQNTNTTVFNTALELMKQAVAEAAGESEVEK